MLARHLPRAGAALFLAVFLVFAVATPLRVVLVAGSSMRPALSPGDVCLIHTGRAGTRGDIALIDRGRGGQLLHRIVANQGQAFVTQGDANPTPDRAPVDPGQIRGIVVAHVGLGQLAGGWIHHIRGGKLHNQSHS